MGGIVEKFRNFHNVTYYLSYYANGNIRIDLYSNDVRLCELTIDVGTKLPKRFMAIKDVSYAEDIIHQMMNSGVIKCYSYRTINDIGLYFCMLGDIVYYPMETYA